MFPGNLRRSLAPNIRYDFGAIWNFNDFYDAIDVRDGTLQDHQNLRVLNNQRERERKNMLFYCTSMKVQEM